MRKIDLNADIGERTDDKPYDLQKDLDLLSYLSSVNLACGYHAGDAHSMHKLVESAVEAGIAVGAHPSYPDRVGFGRSNMNMTPSQIYDIILYQVGALHAFAHLYKSRIHHVKPHGALYNMAARDRTIADAITLAIYAFDKSIILYGLSGSELIKSAEEKGLRTCSEVFSDRTYQEDGSLTPRQTNDAIISNIHDSITQVMMMVNDGCVKSIKGTLVPIVAETICIHGDHENSVDVARQINESLRSNNVLIQQP